MKIGIEVVAANEEVRSGVGAYAFSLLQAMMPQTSGEEVVLFSSLPLRPHWSSLPSGWINSVLNWRLPGWATFRLGRELLRHPPDVLFLPASSPPPFAPYGKRGATVATVHDIGFMRVPSVYAPSDRRRQIRTLRRTIRKSAHILTVSAFTKQELVSVFHVDADRVTVTPLAADVSYRPASTEEMDVVRQKYHVSRHFFLFVSRLDKKKNVETLIRAFTMFKQARGFGDPHELVLAGPDGFGAAAIRTMVAASPVASSIHVLGAIPENDKPALYSAALACVNLSWYEGFGLTPLEAAACGTVSLLSDIPAHRETMGDGAFYVPPNDADVVASKMKHVAEEGVHRDEMLLRAKERLKLFSFERTAAQTWEVLRGVLAPDNIFHP